MTAEQVQKVYESVLVVDHNSNQSELRLRNPLTGSYTVIKRSEDPDTCYGFRDRMLQQLSGTSSVLEDLITQQKGK